jgi:hypothetical protein
LTSAARAAGPGSFPDTPNEWCSLWPCPPIGAARLARAGNAMAGVVGGSELDQFLHNQGDFGQKVWPFYIWIAVTNIKSSAIN